MQPGRAVCPSSMPPGHGDPREHSCGKGKLRISPSTHGLAVCFSTVLDFQVYLLSEEG